MERLPPASCGSQERDAASGGVNNLVGHAFDGPAWIVKNLRAEFGPCFCQICSPCFMKLYRLVFWQVLTLFLMSRVGFMVPLGS